MRTLQDIVRVMLADRRRENALMEGATGINFEHTSLDDLIDDIIREQDDRELQQKQRENELSAQEERLVQTGLQIQQNALRKGRMREVESDQIFSATSTLSKQFHSDEGMMQWNGAIERRLHKKEPWINELLR